ncbi:MAG: HAMP domain-containing protein, partial [Gammaproteobacteria bacterium]
RMPVSIYSMDGELVQAVDIDHDAEYLPVEYLLQSSAGEPAFRIVGLEDVAELSADMARIKSVTITVFLLLAFSTLLLALWLFNRFMLSPLSAMARTMRMMATGKLDLQVEERALRELHELAETFNSMASQVRLRTRDLERLLDLDDNAILCFDHDGEVVYYNRAATSLFGYPGDDLTDLDFDDLFVDKLPALLENQLGAAGVHDKQQMVLNCRHQQGHNFRSDAVIYSLDVLGQPRHAIAFNKTADDTAALTEHGEHRLQAVEQTLSNLLELAKNNPTLLPGMTDVPLNAGQPAPDKAQIREQAVSVMTLALACWEHEMGKSKLELAEQSGIWPVYIDKSTPTTRTLDKYLNLDNCPKNPRSKRVIDTAEFVLRMSPDTGSEFCSRLHTALERFRELLSGVKSADNAAAGAAAS